MKCLQHGSQGGAHADQDQSHLVYPAAAGHTPFWQGTMSRRWFFKTATGMAAAGALLSTGTWGSRPAEASASSGRMPKPISSGQTFFGEFLHIFMPGLYASEDAEPSSITDFSGLIGHAVLSGTGTRTDKKSGISSKHPFEADMRFMQGLYNGVDQLSRRGTFALIALRVFDAETENQLHDFNPGMASHGLVWTVRIPNDSISIDLWNGKASMTVTDLGVEDAFTFKNALVGGGKTPIPAVVSFTVRWRDRENYDLICDKSNGFGGHFVRTSATIKWTGETKRYKYTSGPTFASSSSFAEIALERNGVFFNDLCW